MSLVAVLGWFAQGKYRICSFTLDSSFSTSFFAWVLYTLFVSISYDTLVMFSGRLSTVEVIVYFVTLYIGRTSIFV